MKSNDLGSWSRPDGDHDSPSPHPEPASMSIIIVPNVNLSPSAAPAGQKASGVMLHLAGRSASMRQCCLSCNAHTGAHRDLSLYPGQVYQPMQEAPDCGNPGSLAPPKDFTVDSICRGWLCMARTSRYIDALSARFGRGASQSWKLHTSAAHAEEHASPIGRCGCQEASTGAPGHSCHTAAVAFPDEARRPAIVPLQASERM